MKNLKRILAMIGAILLVLMYVLTLVSVLIDSQYSHSLFKASVFCTFAVPVFIYAVNLVYRLIKDKDNDINKSDKE